VAALTAACAESPTAPSGGAPFRLEPLVVTVSAARPPLDQTIVGQLWVCKEGDAPGTFTFEITKPSGNATVDVAVGECLKVFDGGTVGRYHERVTVRELGQADWAITSILAESNIKFPAGSQFLPVYGADFAEVSVNHDWGTIVTFTNDYTPPPPPPPPPGGCTYTQGYWKNHPTAWPVTSLTLGSVTYTQAELLSILKQPVKGNGLVSLSYQLIAAKLNVATGASPAPTADIDAADALIGGLVVPPVGSGKLERGATSTLGGRHDDFNNGRTGPGHCD
jgi:hypothetical protein